MPAPPVYFAFGSNTNLAQMRERCPDAVPIDAAELQGFAMIFAGNSVAQNGGVATVVRAASSSAWGVAFEVDDRCLLMLDRHEGAPWFYQRATARVRLEQSGSTPTDVVLYVLPPHHAPRMPSPPYVARIRAGFASAGLPDGAIDHALDRTRAAIREAPAAAPGRVWAPFTERVPPPWSPPRGAPPPTRAPGPPPPSRPIPLVVPRTGGARVFVYGTLLAGERNHTLLADADLVGPAMTYPLFSLWSIGGSYPALVAGRGERDTVAGEVWTVDAQTLGTLDAVEIPAGYRRQKLTVKLAGSREVSVDAYLMPSSPKRGERIPAVNGIADWRVWRASRPGAVGAWAWAG